jgi:hypothetical protein
MDDLRHTGSEDRFLETGDARAHADFDSMDVPRMRHKPGPEKKENPRSEKISCRLTKEEKEQGLRYCKTHGITEAKLLRASYLAVITQTPSECIGRMVDALMQPLDSTNLPLDQKLTVRGKIKEVVRKSATILLLVALCAAATPTVAKCFWFVYEAGQSLIYTDHNACRYYTGSIGCHIEER